MTGQAEEKRCFALAERLQKLIAAAGLCSRRTAEEWIAAGRVRVNGETATVGQSADPETDTICVDGVPLTPPERRVYLMLNKPRGYVTTLSDERGRPTAAELVADCGTRVYPVGRLDLDSEGLLLFTNDGAWMQRILHPSHEIEKTYEVTVAGAVENAAAELAAVRSVDGEPIALTPKEYDILYYLMQHPGKVYTPAELYSAVWNEAPVGIDNTVAVHIRHLREKLEIDPSNPRYLKVVWGKGYKLEGDRQ